MQNDQAGSGLRGAESGERGPHRGEGGRQDQVSTVPFRGLLLCQKFGLWYLLAVRRGHSDRLPEGVFSLSLEKCADRHGPLQEWVALAFWWGLRWAALPEDKCLEDRWVVGSGHRGGPWNSHFPALHPSSCPEMGSQQDQGEPLATFQLWSPATCSSLPSHLS